MLEYFEGKKRYIAIFAGLFIFESLLTFYTGFPYDMNVWFKTGFWLNNGINIYLPADHLGYPPLWALWCGFSYKLYTILSYNFEAWRFIIKLPMILAHLVLAYAMGAFAAKRFNIKIGQKILIVALLWSFFIYIGALWGQINVISALLTFLAFYSVSKGKNKTAALALGLAITLKIYPLVVLPAFFAYWLKNSGMKKSVLYAVFACSIPVVFTVLIFTIFQWDILYFLKTIFYWTPVYDSEPTLMQGGCMNIWSFLGTIGVNITKIWILRFIWIPVLAIGSILWLKKRYMNDADLNLAIISFYILFMVTYAWISEQAFIDPLPFILLQVLAFQPKRSYLYILSGVQLVIYGFSITNGGLLIFQPIVEKLAPSIISYVNPTSSELISLIWNVRGVLGLIVSLSLILFLILLIRTSRKENNLKKPVAAERELGSKWSLSRLMTYIYSVKKKIFGK